MKFYKERLLSDVQLKRLGEHKYSCTSNSICDTLLQPWWNWLVSKVPIWLAPNLITLIGLFVNISTTLILVWYSPDAKSEAPRWTFALCGFGLFVYQSLDAIDGKQARRTGSANPLGELFDHGCDSVSTIFVALSACIAVQLGNYPEWMFFQCFCAMTLFYCAHWQTYVSGTLRFGKVDVTEAQYTIIGLHTVSALFGSNIWKTMVCSAINLRMSMLICIVFYIGYAHLCIQCVQRIFKGGCGKNGSSVAGTSVLSPIIPFSTVLLPAFIIYKKSTEAVYENNPALYTMAFGFVAAKITNRLVVAHMTKSEMEYMDWSLLGPAMLFLNQYFSTFIPEYFVLWLCMVYVTLDLLRYCYQICNEICLFLNIELFRISYPGGQQRVTSNLEKNGTNISKTLKVRRSNKNH
ncbi:PREDICTED: choline/ethanolaminephosphotransferase 1 isoform X1 [Nicrophorus vespilloides]|uniref:Choline/ethanolaminephosphotransferase 1 isoform X1 n=1 Tax=Nicrophorus vespilloides TaxID=110193 RepID=A0ABM1MDN6_NICVS|nr:PREDICTED: choline/ethanolaminephosphotransferase 1 isoform X1 [Nicrophorus vespilloides]XP_017772686.1 PREDICTED: choline/ethanolaminephosphotransferase 1 isoform X1 [Nicrophorus vespilloides]XP_017772687.1 PREDICTED: choline/ethanolaminephosphotransferase 1 isoform X1 [Nicrophorus vespilloides]